MSTTTLLERATTWRDDDPDQATRAELDDVLRRVAAGDAAAEADLADRFSGMLEFGTAGLRGALGAGPNRMNRAVVLRAAAGLTAYLQERTARPLVVVGYDARHNSDVFARDTAAVVVAAGGTRAAAPPPAAHPGARVRHPSPGSRRGRDGDGQPQPAAGQRLQGLPRRRQPDRAAGGHRHRGPHRPRSTGSPTSPAPPTAGRCWASDGGRGLPRGRHRGGRPARPARPDDGPHLAARRRQRGRAARLRRRRVRHPGRGRPASRSRTPTFPTVAFPNPEEPGAIDAALALAAEVGADLVLANDPDADRCAVAVPDPAAVSDANPGGWRMLRGDEVGALLGAHVLARGVDADAVFANSIVSSRLLAAHGPRRGRAARGDADRVQVDRPRAGAALRLRGGPRLLRRPAVGAATRTAISAALLLAEMAAGLRAQGRTLLDVLDDLAVAHGRARHRRVLGAGGRPGAHRDGDGTAALDASRAGRRGAGHPGRRPGRRAHRTCRPPTGCATTSRTAAG